MSEHSSALSFLSFPLKLGQVAGIKYETPSHLIAREVASQSGVWGQSFPHPPA